MNTVTINAKINEQKKAEFYHTMESLEKLVKNYCNEFKVNIDPDNKLQIRITFNSEEEMSENFFNPEFNILKGSVRSLCENVNISFNDIKV
jgi:16S rRNA C1402 N4-methylase RsmH